MLWAGRFGQVFGQVGQGDFLSNFLGRNGGQGDFLSLLFVGGAKTTAGWGLHLVYFDPIPLFYFYKNALGHFFTALDFSRLIGKVVAKEPKLIFGTGIVLVYYSHSMWRC